jgi:(4-(4-[2-(gamma-L-glutamylamino)ethyl]phenoxymethyl)furan-2-yl)methanamine synthase
MSWLAVDIGGANLKLADDGAFASVRPFALWKQPDGLAAELQRMLASAPCHRNLAVTMTGELADCFATKSVGVRHILQQVTQAVPQDWQLRVYLTDGRLVSVEAAWAEPLAAAASNWHALAAFAGRFAPTGSALLIDIGSTTCDLIPLTDGCPAISGSDDTQRLLGGHLLYTGVERSPICAVLDRVPYRGGSCPLAQEYFATMRDAYLMLGDLPENAACCETADGQPATRQAAQVRLARMICADASQFDETDAIVLAEAAALAQAESLARALRTVTAPSPPETVIASGHGDFLLRRSLEMLSFGGQVVSLAQRLEPGVSRVAPAHALAVLAKERIAP